MSGRPFTAWHAPGIAASAVGVAILALAGPAPAKPRAAHASAAVAAGREIAMDICSACHIVGDHQEFPPLLERRLPSFQEIADNPATTAKSLRHFITTTHWDEKTIPMTMPNLSLLNDQADQVTQYILSLRKAH